LVTSAISPARSFSLACEYYFRDPDQNLIELITRGFWRTY
jgi:hypothetical protein